MPKAKARSLPDPFRADKYLPAGPVHFPQITKLLHREIWYFGIHGCWESNATLARKFGCCIRSIQRAKKLLFQQQVIILFRALPYTWSMFCRYHPAVRRQQVLYYKGGKADNPFYDIEPRADRRSRPEAQKRLDARYKAAEQRNIHHAQIDLEQEQFAIDQIARKEKIRLVRLKHPGLSVWKALAEYDLNPDLYR